MEELIQNLVQGNFNYEQGSLDFSCTKLEVSIKPNQIYEGSFKIYGPPGQYTKGKVYSSDMRMKCLSQDFVGEEDELFFSFDSAGMNEGDVAKGEFFFLSNQGEQYLPFVVNVVHKILESSLGNIKNLFHFTNLAKSNWQEAIKLFYSQDFMMIFSGNDLKYRPLYQGLSLYKGNEQNMEEFLLSVNKKQPMEYIFEEKEITIEDPLDEQEYSYTITRNGWGYTRIDLQTEGDFLLIEKNKFLDDDFLGNSSVYRFAIKKEVLHDGNNYGTLTFVTPYDTVVIPVTVIKPAKGLSERRNHLSKKHLTIQLMEYYQAFRLRKIGNSTWLRETQKLVDKLISMDDSDPAARLFQGQLLISQERYNEAQWILDHADRLLCSQQKTDSVLRCYYLYLTTLINREEVYTNSITEQVEEIFYNNTNWRIAWLLLYLSEEYNRSVSKKWLFLEEQYQRNCISSVLYIEAVLLLQMNPTLLRKLSGFEIQVLNFAAKKEALNEEITIQVQSLALKEKEFSPVLFQILKAAYTKKPERETLTAICSLLMKGGKTQAKYFDWYRLAVEKEIRLTRLYDYYMLALDLQQQIPIHKIVLMYFSYHSDLDYRRTAYLYADVHRRKEEFQELYLNYLSQIERFVLEQINKMHINRDLAYLYKHYFKEQMVNEETSRSLARLLFMHQIKVDRSDIDKVVVYQPKSQVEFIYPMSEGKANVPLFGADYTILFENNQFTRFAGSIVHTTEKLMIPGKIIKMISQYAQDEIGLNVYLCENEKGNLVIEEDNLERYVRITQSDMVAEAYRNEITLKLVRFYFDNDKMDELDLFLEQINPFHFYPSERSELIGFMVKRGQYEKVLEWCRLYGPYGMDGKSVVRLLNYSIGKYGMQEEPVFVGLAIFAFHSGKYDEKVLRYLMRHYNGMLKELRNIWKAAKSFELDTYELDEKMIVQMLFTGSYVGEKIEIFKDYVRGGAKAAIEEAFLCKSAYDFFVKERIIDGYIFEEIYNIFSREEEVPLVCQLAFLKYYAENYQQATEEMKPFLAQTVKEMLLKEIYLPFMDAFEPLIPEVLSLSDRTIIEYRGNPVGKATIHFIMEKEPGEDGEYTTQEMKNIFAGVYFKEFQLFFGESVQYYIMEEIDGVSQLTESATIQKSNIEKGYSSSKYNLINDIAIAHTLQDYDTINDLLKEYSKTEYLVNNLFEIK